MQTAVVPTIGLLLQASGEAGEVPAALRAHLEGANAA